MGEHSGPATNINPQTGKPFVPSSNPPSLKDQLNMQGGSAGPISQPGLTPAQYAELQAYTDAPRKQAQASIDTANALAAGGNDYGPGTEAGNAARRAGAVPYENAIPLDLAALQQVLGGNNGDAAGRAAAAAVAASLGGQINALSGQANAGAKQIGNLYSQLAQQLTGYIPAEDKAYEGTKGQVGQIYSDLNNVIGGNYDKSIGDISSELSRLGEQQAIPNATTPLTGDKAFLQGLAGIQASGAKSNLNFLQAGAHNYNQNVAGMAKTEGVNQRAQLMQNLQSEIAKAQSANAAAQKSAYSSASKATSTKAPTDIMSILKGLGGSWGTSGANALNSFLGSVLGKTGKYQTQIGTKQVTVKDPNTGQTTTKTVPNMETVPVNQAKIAEQIQKALESDYQNPQNIKTADALAQLIAAIYSGNKNYAGL